MSQGESRRRLNARTRASSAHSVTALIVVLARGRRLAPAPRPAGPGQQRRAPSAPHGPAMRPARLCRGERPARPAVPPCARPASAEASAQRTSRPRSAPGRPRLSPSRPAAGRRAPGAPRGPALRPARFCRGERPAHLTAPPCAQPASAEASAQRASRCTRMPRGDRGPWRARGSCVKIRCAYKRCRSQRCVKT